LISHFASDGIEGDAFAFVGKPLEAREGAYTRLRLPGRTVDLIHERRRIALHDVTSSRLRFPLGVQAWARDGEQYPIVRWF
jgi:hypothetical protein